MVVSSAKHGTLPPWHSYRGAGGITLPGTSAMLQYATVGIATNIQQR